MTSLAELRRFRGSLAKTWIINGSVIEFLRGKSKGGRNKTELRVRYCWRGKVYIKVQSLASVYAGPGPTSDALPETRVDVGGSAVTEASQPRTLGSGVPVSSAPPPPAARRVGGPQPPAGVPLPPPSCR